MISQIYNENYGYSTAVDGYWAAIGNPSLIRYDSNSASFIRTGSVEIFRYNVNTDVHDKKTTLYRPFLSSEELLLITENNNAGITGPNYILHTESTGSFPLTADMDIIADVGTYYTASDDGYGFALDINKSLLIVGNKYYLSSINIGTSSFNSSGSGSVDIFDLSKLEINPYVERIQPSIISSSIAGGNVVLTVNVPASQSFGYVVLEGKINPGDEYQKINSVAVSNSGGSINIQTGFTSSIFFRVSGIVTVNPYLTSIINPNTAITNSFGHTVSINNEWIAVSSIYESGSKGAVFMYQKVGNNDSSWSLAQTIAPPTDILAGDFFGYSLDLNKFTGSYSGSLVVGSLKPSQSRAYVYELISGSWSHSFTLYPDNQTVYPLTFYPTLPYTSSNPNTADSFGHSVSIFKDTIMIGSPTDRKFYEFSGSYLYSQGSVYFFERCPNINRGYYLSKKSYGNEKILKNNLLGISVSTRNGYAIAGSPKINFNTSSWNSLVSLCYLRGTLYQEHFCNNESSNAVNGQFVLFNQTNTGSSINWDITNVYQTKKRILNPYRDYGYNVDICDNFISIGAPMFISGSNRTMDFSSNTGSFTGSVEDLGNLSGKAYLYNLNNLRNKFYVGNIFYRNGKIVIMSSGSSFDGILLTDAVNENIEYNIEFKSKQTLYEKQIVCSVEPGEFNVSTNPTAIILPSSSYDINKNGKFDFQDADVILRYMKYKNTELSNNPTSDWSSSLLNQYTDEEISVYNNYSSSWNGTEDLFTQSYSAINNTLFEELDFNEDNKIDNNDMNILWKYFISRLTQKNYETYITPNSQKKFLSDIIDFLNEKTGKGVPPFIKTDFLNYKEKAKLDPTGSFLAPYVTSIGLYNGTELVAIAKLGSPIKITPDFPYNFIVRMDF